MFFYIAYRKKDFKKFKCDKINTLENLSLHQCFLKLLERPNCYTDNRGQNVYGVFTLTETETETDKMG